MCHYSFWNIKLFWQNNNKFPNNYLNSWTNLWSLVEFNSMKHILNRFHLANSCGSMCQLTNLDQSSFTNMNPSFHQTANGRFSGLMITSRPHHSCDRVMWHIIPSVTFSIFKLPTFQSRQFHTCHTVTKLKSTSMKLNIILTTQHSQKTHLCGIHSFMWLGYHPSQLCLQCKLIHCASDIQLCRIVGWFSLYTVMTVTTKHSSLKII